MTEEKRISFSVSLSPNDYRLLADLAAGEERSMGDTLRRCLREMAQRRGLTGQATPEARRPVQGKPA